MVLPQNTAPSGLGCGEGGTRAQQEHIDLGTGSPVGSKCSGVCGEYACVCAGVCSCVCLSLLCVLLTRMGSVSCSPTVGPGLVTPAPVGTLHSPAPLAQPHRITQLGPAGASSSVTPALETQDTGPPLVPSVQAMVPTDPVPMPVHLARAWGSSPSLWVPMPAISPILTVSLVPHPRSWCRTGSLPLVPVMLVPVPPPLAAPPAHAPLPVPVLLHQSRSSRRGRYPRPPSASDARCSAPCRYR